MNAGKMPHISIFYKVVVVFLALTIPIYTVSLAITRKGADNVKKEITDSMKTRVEFYMNSLEMELDRLMRLQRELITDDDLRNLSVLSEAMSDNERVRAILRFQKRLVLIQSSSMYVEEASVFVPSIDGYITSNQMFTNMPSKLYSSFYSLTNHNLTPIVTLNDSIYIIQREPNPVLAKNPNFILVTKLSKKKIQEAIAQFTGNENGRAYLLSDRLDWAIAGDPQVDDIGIVQSMFKQKYMGRVESAMDSTVLEGQNYFLTFDHSRALAISLLFYVPMDQVLGPIRTYNEWFRLLVVASILVILLFSSWVYRLIHRPLRKLVRTFKQVERGNLGLTISHVSKDEFGYLYTQFNSMLNKIRELIVEVYEQKYLKQRAEFKQLQSQINPHFLYNIFFTMDQMVKMEDYEALRPFIRHTGHYFQFITRNFKDDIPLEQEVGFTTAFIEIQNIRFHNRIELSLQPLPEQLRDLLIPRLTLQPIVENAYKHGLEQMAGGAKLWLNYGDTDGMASIFVEDNGKGVTDEELAALRGAMGTSMPMAETTGLINVHHRLRMHFGDKAGLSVDHGEQGGFRVCIRIPKERRMRDVPAVDRG
ncbi:HAMP domain-containing protein (plasmid) [Paenibacillus rhizovicinus]|uniref:HAMP domain-containing protein n=1 Tax=Paenibacillus rhizovicinus TaxID=2704463 RepID=A0A6C0PAG4_9BACL|nr:histidine kinase [Paenibacillus rhizovicinus]QHW35518.1 HAMP domain-containing protein [Paenibacillus rhizovicinus]